MWGTGRLDQSSVVAEMIAALRHRGPDSNGIWRSDQADLALGHARLAIVDLSDEGRQPMVSRSGRFVIVFNGEIYNHSELRQRLGAHLRWRGHSDTETLLEAVEQWGLVRALQAAVGMFAVVMWDVETRSLTLARDRLGEKPLYYGFGPNGLAFASELKALRHCPGLDFSLDADSLTGFVEFGYIAGPRSAFTGIRKLSPASVLVLRTPVDADATPVSFWSLPKPVSSAGAVSPTPDEDRALVSQLDSLLRQSVEQQVLADVPVGAFLSGGIDSSLIVAVMQKHSSRRIRTFSMGFDNGSDDELSVARRIATHLGTEHTELLVTPDDVLRMVPRLAEIYDEPFADSSQVPTALLCQLTRRHVTVALSGDAGDELFGGYNRYLSASRLGGPLQQWPLGVRRGIGAALGSVPSNWVDAAAALARRWGMTSVPPSFGEKVARVARFLSARSGREAYVGTLSQWLDPSAVPVVSRAAPPQFEDCTSGSLAQQMMYWDLQSYLPDDILVKVDRAAMASSLEVRVPFLDHRIVEFAQTVPLTQKIRGGRGKWLLRELLAREFPVKLFSRPKQGFTLPLDAWLRTSLRDWAESLLEPGALSKSGLLDVSSVRRTWHEHLSGQRNHQRSLWTILMLQEWILKD